MANYVYDTNEGGGTCSAAAYCSGRSLGAGTIASMLMAESLGASLGVKAYTMNASEGPVITSGFFGVVPASVNQIDAQTITVNFRLGAPTTGSPQLNEIHICVLSSGCANLRTVGSVTGLTTSLGAAALYTQAVSVAAPVTVAPGDIIAILLVMTNTTSMAAVAQNFTFNPVTQNTIAMSLAAAGKVTSLPMTGVG